MAVNIATLGDQVVSNIGRGLEEDGALDRDFVSELTFAVPPDKIKSNTGKIKSIDLPAALADSATADTVADVALDAGNTPDVTVQLTDRDFELKKARAQTEYPEGVEGDELFSEVKNYLFPLVDRRIKHALDDILGGIMKGDGVVGDSRDVSSIELSAGSSEVFSDDNSDPLGVFDDAATQAFAKGPQGLVVLSLDKAKELKKHVQIVESILGNTASRAVITNMKLAQLLEEHLNGARIWIGDKQYQNGAVTDALNAQFLFNGVCYVGHKNNIQYRDRGSYRSEWEWFDDDSDVVHLKKKRIYDLNTVFPELSVAIKDVA